MSGDLVSSITQPWAAGVPVQSPGTMGPWLLSEAGDRDGAGCRWENNVLIRKVSTKYRGNFCIHGLSTLYWDACQQNHH